MDVCRRESLNRNGLQQRQVPVLERRESREARAEALTPKAGGTTESGGPGGSQACIQAELSSQGQLKSSRAGLSLPP